MAIVNSVPIKLATTRSATAAAATAVTITLTGVTSAKHVLQSIVWSYSSAPTGGALTVSDGSGSIVMRVDVTDGGPGALNFPFGLAGTPATDLIVTLASGAGTVVGKLNVYATLA